MKIAIFSLFLALSGYGQSIISLKKNKELLRTYEELTNVKTDSEIQRIYQAAYLSLPKNGDVTELNGFTMVSMVNLSHAFCVKMIEKDRGLSASERWIHDSLDLEKEVATWSDGEVSTLINNYGLFFWNEKPKGSVAVDLKSIFAQIAKIEQPLAQSVTLSSVCMAMLTSPLVFTK